MEERERKKNRSFPFPFFTFPSWHISSMDCEIVVIVGIGQGHQCAGAIVCANEKRYEVLKGAIQ